MAVASWCSSGNGNICWGRRSYSENGCDQQSVLMLNISLRGSKEPIWRVLWRKIKRERKRFFYSSSAATLQFTYDPYSYAQNFDRGSMWADDLDDLSRSFSARFAVPSRVFQETELMG